MTLNEELYQGPLTLHLCVNSRLDVYGVVILSLDFHCYLVLDVNVYVCLWDIFCKKNLAIYITNKDESH